MTISLFTTEEQIRSKVNILLQKLLAGRIFNIPQMQKVSGHYSRLACISLYLYFYLICHILVQSQFLILQTGLGAEEIKKIKATISKIKTHYYCSVVRNPLFIN